MRALNVQRSAPLPRLRGLIFLLFITCGNLLTSGTLIDKVGSGRQYYIFFGDMPHAPLFHIRHFGLISPKS